MPIDVTQAPYNCRADWTGSDTTATDNWAGLTAAMNDARKNVGNGYPGVGDGDVLLLPKGVMKISKKLVVPNGVWLRGVSRTASVIKRADSFPLDHVIDLGDATTKTAAMDLGLQDMTLYATVDDTAVGKAMVYTNNAQDTPRMLSNLRIYAGTRMAILGEYGWGGATFIHCDNVIAHTHHADNPVFRFNYGDATQVMLDYLEPVGELDPVTGKGLDGTVGVDLLGGRIRMFHQHSENIHTAINVNLAGGLLELDESVGHPTVPYHIVVQKNAAQLNKITIRNARTSGSTVNLYNAQPANPVMTTTDIDAEVRV